jgi:hypothetical protein
VQPIREECRKALLEHQWTIRALDSMFILDSFLKESARMNTIEGGTKRTLTLILAISANKLSIVAVKRKVIQDYTFQDGSSVSKGTYIGIPNHAIHYDPVYYENPYAFDGYRFSNQRLEPGTMTKWRFSASSNQFFAFGHGRHIW